MATHFSILVWKIPWTEETGRLQSEELQKSQTWLSNWACARTHTHTHTHTLCFQTQTFVFCILPSTLCIVWSPSMREAKPRSKESAKRNPCLTQILSTFTFLSWMIPPKEFFHNTPVLGHTCCCPAPLPFHFSHLSLKIYIFRFLVHVHSERICDSWHPGTLPKLFRISYPDLFKF